MPPTPGGAGLPKVVVRPARKNDAAVLGAFFIRAWREVGPGALGFTGATDDAVKTISSEEFLTQRLSSPRIRIVLAELDREVLGFASIRVTGKREGELSGVVVLQSASRKGIGSKLIRKACQTAMKIGIDYLSVKTEEFNHRAINFYKENEFTESGRTAEKVGHAKVPMMVLGRRLRLRPG